MACCAFAIFLVTQILAPFRSLFRLFGIGGQWKPDFAVEWRPGIEIAPLKRASWKWLAVGALAIDAAVLALVGTPALALTKGKPLMQPANSIENLIHNSICGQL